jgi:ABC-type Mn2+/Zn2+ transport system permease subunit
MAPQALSWVVVISMTIVGWVLASALMVSKARRIVYWL